MKGMARAILLGSVIMTAHAAMADVSAFPGSADDAGVSLPARITYSEGYATERSGNVELAFPGKAPDGVFLPANVTYASTHANELVMTAESAFPGASDESGGHLVAHTTYADTHVAHSGSWQPGQDTDTSGN